MGRFTSVIANAAILVPVFGSLLTSAILSAIGAAKLAALKETPTIDNAHKYVTISTVALWAFFVGGLVALFTLGFAVVANPYLFGAIMILFALANLAIAGILFYGVNAARTSAEYKDPKDPKNGDAKSAFKNLLICGLLMTGSAIFLLFYSFYSIYKYYKGGGLTGDVAIAGQVATALGQPEIGVPLQQFAKDGLTEEQAAAAAGRAQKLTGLGEVLGKDGFSKSDLLKALLK